MFLYLALLHCFYIENHNETWFCFSVIDALKVNSTLGSFYIHESTMCQVIMSSSAVIYFESESSLSVGYFPTHNQKQGTVALTGDFL